MKKDKMRIKKKRKEGKVRNGDAAKPGMVAHSLISALRRQRQVDVYDFQASLV